MPAVVCTHTAQCNATIADGKYAQKFDPLIEMNLEVPIEESRKDGGDEILDHRDDAGGKYICTFVKTFVVVALK